MPATTIKEFLVSLGWDVKPDQQRKFTDALESATLKAKLLGDVIEATAIKLVTSIERMAESFDRLYYLSQRTHATVETIKSFGYAASAMGSSFNEATAAIDAWGRKMALNPGGETRILARVGINPDLSYNRAGGEAFAKLSRPLQERLGQRADLSEALIEMFRHPEQVRKLIDESKRSMAATGTGGEAAKTSADFMEKFHSVWMKLDNVAEGGLTRLLKGLTPLLERFNNFLEAHQADISDKIGKVCDSLLKIVENVTKWAEKPENWEKLETTLTDLATNVGQLATSLGGLTTAFEIFFALWATSKVIGAVATIGRLAGFLVTIGIARLGVAAVAPLLMSGPDSASSTTPPDFEKSPAAQTRDWIKRKWDGAKAWIGGGGGGGGGSLTTGQRAFYQKMYDAAKAAGDPFPEVTAGQAAVESAWGTKPHGNNYFGQTTDGVPGHWKQYDSPEEGLADHMKRWNPKYGSAKNSKEAIANLVAAGYTQDAGYAELVSKTIAMGQSPATGGVDASGGKVIGGANLMESGDFTRKTGITPTVGGDLVQVTTAGGQKFTVNKWAAPNFKAFVEDLEKDGYKINQIGGFNNKNKKNGRPSEHSYGNALDINQDLNPYTENPDPNAMRSNMPPDISQRAARFGLSWGGDWNSIKDPMHFEWRGSPLAAETPETPWGGWNPKGAGPVMPEAKSPYGSLKNYWGNVPPLGASSSISNGDKNVNAPMNVVVNVEGSGDPESVSHMVASKVKRTAFDLHRNLGVVTS